MKEVYVVYGRKHCTEIAGALDSENHFDESQIYGVFATFDSALEEFKSRVIEARDYFMQYTPYLISAEKLEKAETAELFEDYNVDFYFEIEDEVDESEQEPDVRWECYIGNESASWQMTPIINDVYEYIILGSIFIQKEEIK